MAALPWILCYFLPAAITGLMSYKQPAKEGLKNAHLLVVLSIIFMTLASAQLEWVLSPRSIVALLGAGALATYLLGYYGALYTLSAALQQYCILLATTLIVPIVGLPIGAAATALMFALAHKMDKKNVLWKLPLLFCFGLGSIFLYESFHEPLLNVALHTALGAALMHRDYFFESRN